MTVRTSSAALEVSRFEPQLKRTRSLIERVVTRWPNGHAMEVRYLEDGVLNRAAGPAVTYYYPPAKNRFGSICSTLRAVEYYTDGVLHRASEPTRGNHIVDARICVGSGARRYYSDDGCLNTEDFIVHGTHVATLMYAKGSDSPVRALYYDADGELHRDGWPAVVEPKFVAYYNHGERTGFRSTPKGTVRWSFDGTCTARRRNSDTSVVTAWYANGKRMYKLWVLHQGNNELEHRLHGPSRVAWHDNGTMKTRSFKVLDFYDRLDAGPTFSEWYPSGKIKTEQLHVDNKLHNAHGAASVCYYDDDRSTVQAQHYLLNYEPAAEAGQPWAFFYNSWGELTDVGICGLSSTHDPVARDYVRRVRTKHLLLPLAFAFHERGVEFSGFGHRFKQLFIPHVHQAASTP